MLLPSSSDATIGEILDFNVPDIEAESFIERRTLCFDRACPIEDLRPHQGRPPKQWVYSLSNIS